MVSTSQIIIVEKEVLIKHSMSGNALKPWQHQVPMQIISSTKSACQPHYLSQLNQNQTQIWK